MDLQTEIFHELGPVHLFCRGSLGLWEWFMGQTCWYWLIHCQGTGNPLNDFYKPCSSGTTSKWTQKIFNLWVHWWVRAFASWDFTCVLHGLQKLFKGITLNGFCKLLSIRNLIKPKPNHVLLDILHGSWDLLNHEPEQTSHFHSSCPSLFRSGHFINGESNFAN